MANRLTPASRNSGSWLTLWQLFGKPGLSRTEPPILRIRSAKPMLPEPFCGSLSSQLLSNRQKISCIILGNLFGQYSFFHQSCATSTLLLQKEIYPQKSLPNLRQLIFCRLLSRDSPRGRGDSSPPQRSRGRCVPCRSCRARRRQDWSRPSCRSPQWPPEASLCGCR